MCHRLNAQQVDDFSHGDFLFGHPTDPRDVALAWTQKTRKDSIISITNIKWSEKLENVPMMTIKR